MDTNITSIQNIPSPTELIKSFPLEFDDEFFIKESRNIIQNILLNNDPRLLVIIGPCSIHDFNLALQYADYVKDFQRKNPNLFIVMRVYFEKPRSRHGWKGFIYDPDLNNTYNIDKGLKLARELLLKITRLKIPIGCEFLDTISPQYLADLVSWGAIGARTSESQIHRQLASGLSMPIGFKNLTDGDYKKAIDGILSAQHPHQFLGIDYKGMACHVTTKGNQHTHLILRGGVRPNYYQEDIEEITYELYRENIKTGIIVDCSHGNSSKEYMKQILVACSITKLLTLNKYPIKGVMIESHINSGNQKLHLKDALHYGISITDGCIDVRTSEIVLNILNEHMTIKEMYNINEVRNFLDNFDEPLISLNANQNIEDNMYLYGNILSPEIVINYDDELYEIVNNNSKLMCYMHKRLGVSELIARIKFELNPYDFMLKENNFYKLITDRNREQNILDKVGEASSLYIKMMELSKRIQIRYLEKYVETSRIGYMGNRGSFSSEVVKIFYGNYIGCTNFNDIINKLSNNEIHYGLVPIYNSLIGSIYTIGIEYKILGTLDYKIRLALFANDSKTDFSNVHTLYVQEVVYKEALDYIKRKFNKVNIVICNTTEEGCLKCIKSENINSMTIASENNECNYLYTVERDIIEHNITTFALISNI